MGTKMRALYQRQKGRDLFDLYHVLEMFPNLDSQKVIGCFQKYLAHEHLDVSRAEFEANMHDKMSAKRFRTDIHPILHPDQAFDIASAYERVHENLIARLPGEPWEGNEERCRFGSLSHCAGTNIRKSPYGTPVRCL